VEIIMRKQLVALLALMALAGITLQAEEKVVSEVLNHTVKNIEGKEVKLADYEGKVILVVNVASQCGLTPQYKGLEAAYEKYKDQGFVILGFPCNQFGAQEPGSEAEIQKFCSSKYNVTFPMFSKIEVNGKGTSPLYQSLKAKFPGDIKWNFEKFLINKKGEVVNRFGPRVTPEADEIKVAIEAELKK
jgi:glutathione peroxidase